MVHRSPGPMEHTEVQNQCLRGAPAMGFPVSMFAVDDVLGWSDVPVLFTAHDGDYRYLVVEVRHDGDRRSWLLAPLSDRALECALSGRADLRDVFRHTCTGTVDLVTASEDGHVTDSVQLCRVLDDDVLPSAGWHLARGASRS